MDHGRATADEYLEQPDLSSEDDMSSSDSSESVEGKDMKMSRKKRETIEKGDENSDIEDGKKFDEALSTATYESEDGEGHDDDDPSKFRPTSPPKMPRGLVPLHFAWLTVSSLGIVYGDLGTSPLYTWPTILSNLETWEEDDLIGAMCILVYSLIFIVTIKYATFVMMADNKGEGGIFALTSLVPPTRKQAKKLHKLGDVPPRHLVWVKRVCTCLCIIGAGFIMGDGAITPAVSVLSAIEGLGVANDRVVDYEVILGCTILGLLFLSQSFGSSKIGFLFGPIMLVWFGFIGAVGIYNIVTFDPSVFRAFNPYWAYVLFQRRGTKAFEALGGVCLCFTGVEALYADMGHFGRWPIRVGWALVVFPSVLMSYFGQLAYVLAHPDNLSGPVFFASVPTPAYWPMLVVATMASVIGAQSLISATFSLISQAIGLEAFPPVALHHTSASIQGQVYAPTGNWLLMATSIGLILFFQSSGALASAFGIAVTGTMAITTLIFMAMVILRWRWSALVVVPIGAAFFLVEMVYFSANMVKFNDGGWVALLLAAVAIIFMGSWKLGRVDVHRTLAAKSNRKTMRDVVGWANDANVQRVPGTGVFMGSDDEIVPKSLLQHFKIHRSLPTTVVTVHTKTIDLPRIKPDAHFSCRAIGPGLVMLTVRRGFVERRTDTSEVLQHAEHAGVLQPDSKSPRFFYFISRQTVVLRETRRLWSRARLGLYNFMVMSARPPACVSMVIPHNQRIEYHSELPVKKPLPGDNVLSRFINHHSAHS